MSARVVLAGGVLALALVGVAAWTLLDAEDPAVEAAGPTGEVDGSSRPGGALGRALSGRGGRRVAVQGVVPELAAEGSVPGDAEIDAKEAEAGLANIFAEMDQVITDRRHLSEAEYSKWKDRAGAAFAAFQDEVDAEVPEARARLDRAHRQLEARLEKLRARVRTPSRRRRPDPDPLPRLDRDP